MHHHGHYTDTTTSKWLIAAATAMVIGIISMFIVAGVVGKQLATKNKVETPQQVVVPEVTPEGSAEEVFVTDGIMLT